MCFYALSGLTASFTVIFVVFKQTSREGLGYVLMETDSGACVDESAVLLSTKTMAELHNKINRPLQTFINNSLLIPPLVNYRENFMISLKYNLATCQIEKIMCTFRAGMFCYLNRRRKFVEEGRSISTERWGSMLCERREKLRNTFERTIQSLSKQPTIFSIIRHPIDRFLSGFVDKCILSKVPYKCFNCSEDIGYFLLKIHENLLAYYTKSRTLTQSDYFYIQHFAPTNWYCNLKKSYNKMLFMRYNRYNRTALADGFVRVLNQAFVPHSQTDYVRKEVLKLFSNPLPLLRHRKLLH